jgi:hypothetical protein
MGQTRGLGGDALKNVVDKPENIAFTGRMVCQLVPHEFMMLMAFDEMPVSGWTCLSTR